MRKYLYLLFLFIATGAQAQRNLDSLYRVLDKEIERFPEYVAVHDREVALLTEELRQDKDDALRISSGLGGGLFHGEVCGTVSAAAVAISMKYGFHEPNPGEIDDLLKAKVHEFEDRFIERFGSLRCKDLLGGYDCLLPEDGQAEGVPEDPWEHCGEYCAYACELLDEILA